MFLSSKWLGIAALGSVSLACLPACSSDNSSNEQSSLASGIVREGSTTTAALNAFLAAEPDDWPWAGGQFVTPKDQDVLPAATPEVFTWHADSTLPPDPADQLSATQQQGQVFLLVFSTAADAKLLRVFTSLNAYTPSAANWQKLARAGAPITLSITSGTFENDRLTGDGGPHNGQTLGFTIQ